MIFSTPIFLFFFVIVFLFYWFVLPALLKGRRLQNARHLFLLLASYIFYTYSVWQYGLLIALSTLIDYVAGLVLARFDTTGPSHSSSFKEDGTDKQKRGSLQNDASPESQNTKKITFFGRRLSGAQVRKLALLVSLSMNLGILGYFKYADFFIDNFLDFLEAVGAAHFTDYERQTTLLRLVLPVGISFFTFQSMSYTIDVYRRVIPAEKSLLRFALFISFFPQLVAGPIVTAREFLPQLDKVPKFDLEEIKIALRYFGVGYFKKVVLADNMAPIVEQIYHQPAGWGTAAHWLGALAFWVQVYGDFSGYSDMAIGTARLLGFALPENFRMPYLSRSVTEHWQRWHMSLIRWNRDYIYIPLGGSQVSFWRHKWNIFITMFLAGVWHGANWTFVIWGAIHGCLLVLESLWKNVKESRLQARLGSDAWAKHKEKEKEARKEGRYFVPSLGGRLRGLLQLAATSFITIYFGTMFRSNNIQDSLLILSRMLGLQNAFWEGSLGFLAKAGGWAAPTPAMLKAVGLSALIVFAGHIIGWQFFEKRRFRLQMPSWLEFALWPIFILLCIQFGYTGVQAFIYFQF